MKSLDERITMVTCKGPLLVCLPYCLFYSNPPQVLLAGLSVVSSDHSILKILLVPHTLIGSHRAHDPIRTNQHWDLKAFPKRRHCSSKWPCGLELSQLRASTGWRKKATEWRDGDPREISDSVCGFPFILV